VGQEATLGVLPQYLDPVADDAGMLHGRVSLTERLGSETVLDVTLRSGDQLIAALPEDMILTPGTNVSFDFDPDRAYLFPEVE
jgi:multiple sugar transport system ATP-binding protein